MDTGVTNRPVSGVVASDYVRPAAVAAQAATATDLPDSKAVTPAADASSTPNDPSTADAAASYMTRNVTIDPQTREVIYRVIDTRTQQVVQQVPDQALLRNRAYSKAIADGATPFQAQAKADLET